MGQFTEEYLKPEELRKWLLENLVIGKTYNVTTNRVKEGWSTANYIGGYKALAIYPHNVAFLSPGGHIESFTLMDAVNIAQGIPID